jgi:predicted ester cyclase
MTGNTVKPDPKETLAQALVRIGETAIAKEDDEALRDYFAPGYVLHLPRQDIDFEALKSYFAQLRSTFPDLRVSRNIVFGEGRYLAARTLFSGTFAGRFAQPRGRVLEPTGRRVEWEIMNIFRYDGEGRLAEEWVQSDPGVLLDQLAASLRRTSRRPPRP